KYKELIKEDTLLIHYTGATKPWHKWAIYPSVKYYKIALERSPWKDDSPRDAKSIIEFKKINKKYKELIKEDTLLIHYTGATKPWHKWAIYPSVKYYKIALERSP
ncbi:hypothetical protein J4U37_25415, partial [Escherichia coli]